MDIKLKFERFGSILRAKMKRFGCLRIVTIFVVLFMGCCGLVGPPSMEDTFRQCLVSKPGVGFGFCLGMGAITKLQSLDNDPEFDLVDGLTMAKDNNKEYRDSVYNFAERDPSDVRTIIDSIGHVFSRRNMHWDMSFVYPGLGMHVTPSGAPGGTLEFVLDPHREAVTATSLKEAGTGRLLARQFLIPFLLGFKFNVATIVPILFGILALIAKKAVFISKLALIASSAFGLGSLLLGQSPQNLGNKYQTYTSQTSGSPFNPSFGGGYNRYPEDEYPEVYYRTKVATQNADQLNLYATNLQNDQDEQATENKSSGKGRNFAWSENEKKNQKARK